MAHSKSPIPWARRMKANPCSNWPGWSRSRARSRGWQHLTLYTGYTLAHLTRRPAPLVREILALTDLLIDGRYVAALAEGAGEWRGSRNQRIIPRPSRFLAGVPASAEGVTCRAPLVPPPR